MKGFVYFMRPIGMAGPVKIGFSKDPEGRRRAYNLLSPWPLEVAAQIAAEPVLEYAFHARFMGQRTHHEWFRASPKLTETIRQVAAGVFDVASLPPSKRVIGNYHSTCTPPASHPAEAV